MKDIYFATTNERKVREARAACDDFGITINQIRLEIDEIQHHDPIEISKDKAKQAFQLTEKPIVITDTSWTIPSLNGFPGGYMKDVAGWFSSKDFINLLSDKNDRRISFTETIVYQDSKISKIFSQEYQGVVSDKPRGTGNSIEQVAEFNGYTIGEKMRQNKTSHDPKEYVWYQFAKWYANR